MIDITKHMEFLGMRVEDRVTGFKGVVTSVSFDLYGCIQAIVNPGVDESGKPLELAWFDIGRLRVTDPTPVMEMPEFDWAAKNITAGKKGPAEKPSSNKF